MKTSIFWFMQFLLWAGWSLALAGAGHSATMPAFAPLPSLDAYVDAPTAVTVDSRGRVYVVEPIYNRVRIFSQSGALLATLSGLANPTCAAVDGTGRIYVGNSDLGNVTVYGSDLQQQFKLGAGDGEFADPADIEIDADGLVHVVDRDNNAMRVYNPSGALLWSINTPGNGDGQLQHPTSVAIDTVAAELVILDHKQVWDANTATWIDGARLQFFSLNGTFLRGYDKFGYNMAAGQLVKPQQVTVDGESRVYVTDSRLQKVMVYSNTNTFLGMIDNSASPLRTPLGLSLSGSGRLYVVARTYARVDVFGIDSYTAMTAQPSSLLFNAAMGGDAPAAQTITVHNSGNEALTWGAAATSPWLSLPVPGGTVEPSASEMVPVAVLHAGLAAGTYQDSVVLTGPGMEEKVAVTLVVGKGTATVSLGNLEQTYDGTPKPASATTVPEGLAVNITYDGIVTPPTDAGTYTVVATVSDPGYQGTATGTLTIGKAGATVILGSLDQTYDGTPRAATASTAPAGLAVTVTYDGAAAAPTDAGSYGVVATINDPNYQGSASGTLTIDKATATLILGSLNQTYDTTPKAATATTDPQGLAVVLTYDGAATPPTNAGSYIVVGTVNDTNYQGLANGTLTINKATAIVTLGSLNQTYDTTPKAATATTAPLGLTVVLTYDGADTPPTAAGSYAVVGSINDPNYQGSASGTLTIGDVTATVTLGSLNQTYDGTPKAATATTDPQGLAVVLTYDGAATPPTNAGSYGVVATINDPNYQGSAAGTLTIDKATATVTLGSLNQTYDTTPKAATATTDPQGLTVDLTYDGSATAPTAAGSYVVVGTVNDTNYQGLASGTLTIDKATATVTLGNLNQPYDGTPKAATATTAPLGLTVVLTYDGAGTPPTAAGSYGVVATINDPNYQGSASGTLTIGNVTATVTLGSLNQTYDGTPKAATVTTDPQGLAVVLTYDGAATPPTNAGSYGVVATINDPNYQGSASGTLTIDKATVTVSLGSLNQTYDTTPKAATATTDPQGLTVVLTYDGAATPPTAAGSYVVVGTVNDTNYQGSASGTLTITKATATVTLGNLNQPYDGTPKAATATTAPLGLTVVLTYDGAATPPTAAGSYGVVATINDPNYQGSASGTLTIGNATATVTLGSLNQTYDGTPKTATATTDPQGLAVVLTYDGAATPPTNAGSYTVVATINDPNYQGSASGTLTIDKATATVTLGNLNQPYDTTPKAATATTDPQGLIVDLTYDGAPAAPTAAGSYAVVGTVNDPNYQGLANGTLIISAVLPAVTTTEASAVSATGALSGGNVSFDGGTAVTARGVCWNEAGSPTTADSCTSDGAGTGPFASILSGLASGKVYSARAYATNSVGTEYGNEISFTTVATRILNISKEGKGSGTITSEPAGIDCGTDCTESFEDARQVTLTATPDPGARFTGWSGDADCEDGVVTLTADLTCTATFYRFPWLLFQGAIKSAAPPPE